MLSSPTFTARAHGGAAAAAATRRASALSGAGAGSSALRMLLVPRTVRLCARAGRRSAVAVAARYRSSTPDVQDRVLAAVPYLLPFLDAFGYGRFLFYQYPAITRALSPMSPLLQLYASVPFAPLIGFFAVYLGIVQNQRWSRFVRFNGMQAMLLDILLILPRLAEQVRPGLAHTHCLHSIYMPLGKPTPAHILTAC
jgi:Chloroplast import apparatus Tic20-like